MTTSSIVVPSRDAIDNYPPALGDALIAQLTAAKADLDAIFAGGALAATTGFKARAVITSIAAYTGSGTGVLTGSVNNAIGAQDGVTLVAGDQVLLPAGLTNVTAADAGPYTVTVVGTAGTKYVLTRPSWWAHGGAIVQAAEVRLSGEGTVFKGTTWRALCAKAKLIGTDDPVFYPDKYQVKITLSSGTYTIGAGGGNELLWLLDTTRSSVQLTSNTHAGTIGTSRLEAPSGSRIAGNAGTAAIVVNSLVDAGTVAGSDSSTVDVLVVNF